MYILLNKATVSVRNSFDVYIAEQSNISLGIFQDTTPFEYYTGEVVDIVHRKRLKVL
jgi:hypothetical protein